MSTPAAGPPQRVRVTSSRRGAAPMRSRPVSRDLDEQTGQGGEPFPWLSLGVAVYPAAWFLARWYTRQAERIEQDFADVVESS